MNSNEFETNSLKTTQAGAVRKLVQLALRIEAMKKDGGKYHQYCGIKHAAYPSKEILKPHRIATNWQKI